MSKKPMIIKGMPTGAATTSNVKINPTIIKTKPRIAATNRPVKLRMKANKSQIATNGHKNQGVLLFSISDITYSLLYIYEEWHAKVANCKIHGYY